MSNLYQYDGSGLNQESSGHLEGLGKSLYFLNFTIYTERDKILRIKQVHRDCDGGLFKDDDFDGDEGDQIL